MGATVGVNRYYLESGQPSPKEGDKEKTGKTDGNSTNRETSSSSLNNDIVYKWNYSLRRSSASNESTDPVNPSILETHYYAKNPYMDYRFVKKIGQGKYSTIFIGNMLKNEKHQVAIKEVRIKEMSRITFSDFKYELNMLSQLSHPAILRIIGVYDPSPSPSHFFYVITEYMKGGEFINALLRSGSYKEDDILFYMNQVISGLSYLHTRDIVHGNLIPENIIFVNPKFSDHKASHIKIVGFENAEAISSKRYNSKGLIDKLFRSPELLNEVDGSTCRATKETDVWSFGIILYLLLTGHLPFFEAKPSLIVSSFILVIDLFFDLTFFLVSFFFSLVFSGLVWSE
jgi:serine/threonine protein kinase